MVKLKRILIVEDFDDFRFSLRRLLEIEGYEVIEATDGMQAINIASQSLPDLILMDLSLPGLDGLETTRRLRQTEQLKVIPIIAISAHDTEDFHDDAIIAGCNAYITKPVDFDQLETAISKLLP